ncbi:hypothetical protein [Hafnia alvei]|nr:hypothetical protein [Hafnia alvei]QQE44167.1 hypothetical protein I6H95_02275 [Hafnia alvei]
MKKEHERSFTGEVKEPVIERIFKLVERYNSRVDAAKAWGINVNTLQNYYKRKDVMPVPREKVLRQIAEREGVSLAWLLHGGVDESLNTKNTTKNINSSDVDLKLLTLLGMLTEEEKLALFAVLARKGVETVLYLLDEDNIKLLKLDRVMKEKVLGLQPQTLEDAARIDEEARECGANNESEMLPQSLASNNKRAG